MRHGIETATKRSEAATENRVTSHTRRSFIEEKDVFTLKREKLSRTKRLLTRKQSDATSVVMPLRVYLAARYTQGTLARTAQSG